MWSLKPGIVGIDFGFTVIGIHRRWIPPTLTLPSEGGGKTGGDVFEKIFATVKNPTRLGSLQHSSFRASPGIQDVFPAFAGMTALVYKEESSPM